MLTLLQVHSSTITVRHNYCSLQVTSAYACSLTLLSYIIIKIITIIYYPLTYIHKYIKHTNINNNTRSSICDVNKLQRFVLLFFLSFFLFSKRERGGERQAVKYLIKHKDIDACKKVYPRNKNTNINKHDWGQCKRCPWIFKWISLQCHFLFCQHS